MFIKRVVTRYERREQGYYEKTRDNKNSVEDIFLLEIKLRDEYKEVEVEEKQHDGISDEVALRRARENKILLFRGMREKKYREYQEDDTADDMPPKILACAHEHGV